MTASTTKLAMRSNLSFHGRQFRFALGSGIIALVLAVDPNPMGLWSLALLTSIPLIVMAIIAWDPVYALLGKTQYIEGEEDIRQRSWSHPNIGSIDRVARLGTGLILIYSLMTMSSMQGEMAIALLAIPLIVSAIIAWDPVYAALGTNSFASSLDVVSAEPETAPGRLANYYEFPDKGKAVTEYIKAA